MTEIKTTSERRWAVLDQRVQGGVLAAVQEVKPALVDPNQPPPALFNVSIMAQVVARDQLVAVHDLIKAALDDAPESKIVSVPAGTRLGPPAGVR
jgi:hypothetical protein